jgi:autotransporter strand-loop-strand O-heptosyltransferase
MGQDVFEFVTSEIDRDILSKFSEYILSTVLSSEPVNFSVSFKNGIVITNDSNKPQQFYVKIVNKNTNEILYDGEFLSSEVFRFNLQYYVDCAVFIYDIYGNQVHQCDVDLYKKVVGISLKTDKLEDVLSWIPYVDEFQRVKKCSVVCKSKYSSLFEKQYSDIRFVELESDVCCFAEFSIQTSSPVDASISPIDYRTVSPWEYAAKSLELNCLRIPTKMFSQAVSVGISNPIVVISTDSDLKAKCWNNSSEWQSVVDCLSKRGFSVVTFDDNVALDNTILLNESVENKINLLSQSVLYVGVNSEIAHLSIALNKPSILIDGFSGKHKIVDSNIHYVSNELVCNGCFSDKTTTFDASDWMWCPRRQNFECNKSISATDVIIKINQVLESMSI